MSASQLRLLTLFVDRAGEVVTRDDVAARLWSDTRNIDVSTGINTAINRLRRHLRDSPEGPPYIETVIGLGYRFVATVEKVEPPQKAKEKSAETQAGAALAPEPPTPTPTPSTPEASARQALAEAERGEQTPGSVQTLVAARQVRRFAAYRTWAALATCAFALLALLAFAVLRHPQSPRTNLSAATASMATPPLTRVTADEEVDKLTAAAVAPNGESVAYADRSGVSVHWFASGAERLLGVQPSFRVNSLSWLPSGDGLLMSGIDEVLGRQQVWRVPLQGAYLALLAENADRATVSPQGRLMAFTRNGDRELWLADADGEHPRLLRNANAGESFNLLLWSPTGNRLVVTLRKSAVPVNADTNPPAKPSGLGAYECIDAASAQVLAREEGFAADSGYLLADGRFYFVTNETPGPTTGEADLTMVPTDPETGRFRGTPQVVGRLGARHAQSLTASSTGARFAAVLDRAEIDVEVADLHPPDFALKNVVRLTRGARQNFPHSWTADGKGVLFESDALQGGADAGWAIYSQQLDRAKPSLIASLPQTAAMAQLSPDGRWILFLEFTGGPQHASGIFRVPAAGGKIEPVMTRGAIEEFHCSASSAGRCVLREAIGNEALVYYALDPEKGMGQELGRTPWQPNRLGDWSLSADGLTVAAAGHDVQSPAIQLIKLGAVPIAVHTIAVPGHGTTLGANWAANGQFLFVESKTQAGFELLALDLAGHVRLLRPSPSLIWAVPSRDGQKVAFPNLNLSESLWTSTAK